MNNFIIKVVSFLILFLGSLRGFNIGGMRVFVLMSLLILLVLTPILKFDRKYFNFIVSFYFLVFLNLCLSPIISSELKPHLASYLGIFSAPLYGFLFFSFFNKKIEVLEKSLRLMLWVHLFFFYVQFFSFLIFHIKIDYLEFLTGEPQRTIGGIFTEETIIRTAGLSNEPASYGIFAVSSLVCLFSRDLKLDKLKIFTIASILLSFSASGIMFIATILIILFSKYLFSVKKALIYILVLLACAALYQFFIKDLIGQKPINAIFFKISNFTESQSFKIRVGNSFSVFKELSFLQKIFGTGIANTANNNYLGSFLSQFFIQGGMFFFTSILLIFYWCFFSFKVRKKFLIIAFLLTLSTHMINHLVTWYFMTILLIFEYSNENYTPNLRSKQRGS